MDPKSPRSEDAEPLVSPDAEAVDSPEPFPEDSVHDRGGIADMFRKAMVAGLGTFFMTEEGIRSYVKELKLPKEVVGFVLSQAERSKGEVLRVVSEEMRRFLESETLRREIVRLLSQMTIEVKAEIRLKPETGAPEVKISSATARPARRAPRRSRKKA